MASPIKSRDYNAIRAELLTIINSNSGEALIREVENYLEHLDD